MKKINFTIKVLISSISALDIAIGFTAPIMAIFFSNQVIGGSARVAGTAVAVDLLTRSIFRVPLAYYLDKQKGENHDFYSLVLGLFLISLSQFLYTTVTLPIHVYLIQAIMGIGGAFAFTPWYGLFSRHIDKRQEDFEWSIATALAGTGAAIAGYLGGVLVTYYGFKIVFIISGTVMLIGMFSTFLIKDKLRQHN